MTQSATVQPLNQEELISSFPHAKFHSIMYIYFIVSISHLDVSTFRTIWTETQVIYARHRGSSGITAANTLQKEEEWKVAVAVTQQKRLHRWQRPPPLWGGDALRWGSRSTSWEERSSPVFSSALVCPLRGPSFFITFLDCIERNHGQHALLCG